MNVTHFRVIINQVHYIENSLLSIFTYIKEQYGITFNKVEIISTESI